MFHNVYRPVSVALIVVAALHGVSCASAAQARRQDLLEVAQLGLAEIESMRGPVIIVAGPQVTSEERSTLSQLRSVITPGQVPESDRYRIPDGYFVLQQLSVRGTRASLVGIAGPWFKNHPDSCGSTIDVSMRKAADGVWRVASKSATQC